jgi:hypothetical protein
MLILQIAKMLSALSWVPEKSCFKQSKILRNNRKHFIQVNDKFCFAFERRREEIQTVFFVKIVIHSLVSPMETSQNIQVSFNDFLPQEILREIFLYLFPSSIFSSLQTCKSWHKLQYGNK